MKQEMVTIPKKEYKKLKTLEKVESDIVEEYKQILQDLKDGKFIEC